MLIGASIEFKVVDSIREYQQMEGSILTENSKYVCIGYGESFFVVFKEGANSQVLIITPDWSNNLDADGGTKYMRKNVLAFIDSLVSESIYI